MKAAILREYGRAPEIEEVPKPVPGPGEILVQVEACGVCHSDLHLAQGDWKMMKSITKLPLILGHEVIGRVVEAADGFKAGDRVGVPWLHWTCGACEYCQAGRETLCPRQLITGCSADGGFAEFIKAKASHAVKLPEALGGPDAAPLLCAGLTAYKALKTSGLRMGERVAIFGIGGLGHMATQVAKAMGAQVIAVDISEDKLQLARECGADWTMTTHKEIRGLGGAHVALVTSASSAAYETALRSLKPGGTLVVVGMGPDPIPLSSVAIVSGEYRLIGSAVGTRQDLSEVLALAADRKIRCHASLRPLSDVAAVLSEMKDGRLLGRVVVQL